MTTKQKIKKDLQRLQELFSEADDILREIPNPIRDAMLEYHNEDATLPHCVEWGLQASEEILADFKKFYKDIEKEYDI